jgi:D-glycero-beta-D-manno-heptose-7-phosphate kinase
MQLAQLFEAFNQIKIGVIGDIMLDTYWWGNVERVSPEAPVPIVAVNNKEQRIGGAGNVALNLVSLGAQVHYIGVFGNDADGAILQQLLNTNTINSNYSVTSTNRVTTNKIRVISRNQHMMRLDVEQQNDLPQQEATTLLQSIKNYITTEKPALIILEDYNKGVLTEAIITETINLCKQHNVFVAVDPKQKNFFAYKGATIFKPNLKEIKEGLNVLHLPITEAALQDMHQQLQAKLQHQVSLITLSEHGVFFATNNQAQILPIHIRTIADVSGAGDTVIAVAALTYAATQNVALMAALANIAGGLVCEEVGTVAINKQKLLAEASLHLS